mgnify:CR=1 FL=1
MTTEQANRISASVFRQTFLLKMLQTENNFFLKQHAPSGVKNALNRGAKAYGHVLTDLRNALPKGKDALTESLEQSEEKIFAMASILEKLSALPEKDVLQIEETFDKYFKVVY